MTRNVQILKLIIFECHYTYYVVIRFISFFYMIFFIVLFNKRGYMISHWKDFSRQFREPIFLLETQLLGHTSWE